MTKKEKIERLQKAYRHESKAECRGNEFATAEEQKKTVAAILGGIVSQLRRLGVDSI